MDKKRDTTSNKKNWLAELSDLTEDERDNFLKFVCVDHEGKKQNKAMCLEFAEVSIFYRRNKNNRSMMNMRVSNCFNIYGNDTLC
jgi:NADH:ubiquinone oxidoreductase subunit C